jgi:hypothetical protein
MNLEGVQDAQAAKVMQDNNIPPELIQVILERMATRAQANDIGID